MALDGLEGRRVSMVVQILVAGIAARAGLLRVAAPPIGIAQPFDGGGLRQPDEVVPVGARSEQLDEQPRDGENAEHAHEAESASPDARVQADRDRDHESRDDEDEVAWPPRPVARPVRGLCVEEHNRQADQRDGEPIAAGQLVVMKGQRQDRIVDEQPLSVGEEQRVKAPEEGFLEGNTPIAGKKGIAPTMVVAPQDEEPKWQKRPGHPREERGDTPRTQPGPGLQREEHGGAG